MGHPTEVLANYFLKIAIVVLLLIIAGLTIVSVTLGFSRHHLSQELELRTRELETAQVRIATTTEQLDACTSDLSVASQDVARLTATLDDKDASCKLQIEELMKVNAEGDKKRRELTELLNSFKKAVIQNPKEESVEDVSEKIYQYSQCVMPASIARLFGDLSGEGT